MSNIYFTSDQHFNHKNIIKYCDRPFDNVNKMNNHIIGEYNKIVNDDDIVYFLGDIMMEQNFEKLKGFIKKLKGRKILILGNHDEMSVRNYLSAGFDSVHSSLQLGETNIYMTHDPAIYNALPDGSFLICGHVHQLFRMLENKPVINVGVDVWNFRPVELETLMRMFNTFNRRYQKRFPNL